MPGAEDDDLVTINRIRLSVARAAQRDSLGWWDDEALTPGAELLLKRLFPRSSQAAAQRLATRGAKARHAATLQDVPDAKHLFFLGDAVEFQLEQALARHAPFDLPRAAIASRQQLAGLLRQLGPEPPAFPITMAAHGRSAAVAMPIAAMSVLDTALGLAWAYTRVKSERSVLPYTVDETAA